MEVGQAVRDVLPVLLQLLHHAVPFVGEPLTQPTGLPHVGLALYPVVPLVHDVPGDVRDYALAAVLCAV